MNNCFGNLKLVVPNPSHEAEYGRVMDRWESLDQTIQPELMRRYSKKAGANIPYQKWLENCEDDRTTGSMLSTHVPCTLYFLVNEMNEILGCIVMNHDDTLRGHLHAGIVPWHRGKGYGTIMLGLALEKCCEMGIQKIHIVPRKDNVSAIKTIINNNGTLLNEFYDNGVAVLRYEIEVCNPFNKI